MSRPGKLLDERFTDRVLALLSEFDLPAPMHRIGTDGVRAANGAGEPSPCCGACSRTEYASPWTTSETGYSSLTSLEQLPLSRIKLDRSLIVNVDTSLARAAIAKAILELCAGWSSRSRSKASKHRSNCLAVEPAETSMSRATCSRAGDRGGNRAAKILPVGKMHDLLLTVGPGRRSAPFVPALTQQAIMAKG